MDKILRFTLSLAEEAGQIALKGMDKVVVEKNKDKKRDICTNIDLRAEEMIIKRIRRKYPDHKILSEEGGRIDGESDYIWLIDPIDGTKYYAANIKLFTVSIALWKGVTPLVGVVYLPALNDFYFAKKGGGAFCNKKQLKVSDVDSLDRSIICLELPAADKLEPKESGIAGQRLGLLFGKAYRLRALGVGSLASCFVAKGGYEAYFDLTGRQTTVDMAAAIPIAREAGAKVTGLDGKYHGWDVSNILITNGKIHDKLLKLLNSVG